MAATLVVKVSVCQDVYGDRVRLESRDEPAGREGSSGIDQDVPGHIDVDQVRLLQRKEPQLWGYAALVHGEVAGGMSLFQIAREGRHVPSCWRLTIQIDLPSSVMVFPPSFGVTVNVQLAMMYPQSPATLIS